MGIKYDIGERPRDNKDKTEIVNAIYEHLQKRKKPAQRWSKKQIWDLITVFEKHLHDNLNAGIDSFCIPLVGTIKPIFKMPKDRRLKFTHKSRLINIQYWEKTFNEIFKIVA